MVFVLAEIAHQGKPEDERFDGLQAEDHQGVADGADVLAAAVEAAVDGAEDFRGEGRVLVR